jgi:putative membrane-bound dehydrogenase-like protein
MRNTSWFVTLGLLAACAAARADQVRLGLRLPDGFEVTEYAGSDLANDIFCMTIDPQGRVIVSGRGYTRILVDDGHGKAARATDFLAGPKDGAMGLLWEGDSLLVVGDGGLRRYRDADGDGKPDGPPELIRALKTGGEHDAHALRRGPDGWLYLLCGNNTGIDRRFAELPTSPIEEPVAGCVVRFAPDLKRSEIVADGFRNPYGMDFNADGELFTFDSDNERCVSLPWYEPTRFYHVVPGGHHGWLAPQRAQFWRLPPYFPDVVAPVAMLGRGSPTGVVCYRHARFPAEYRGGFFLADWTFGRIYFLPLERAGKSYRGTPQVFLQSVGDNGFAPTALAVHPKTGDLFVSIGGRGTRGAVYRIHYAKGAAGIDPREVARWQPKPRSLQAPGRGRDYPVSAAAALLPAVLVSVSGHADPAPRLTAVRAVQLGLGGLTAPGLRGTVWEGYSPHRPVDERLRTWLARLLAPAFPSGDPNLDRELSRTLAMIEADMPDPERIAARIDSRSDPVEDVHYLIVLARLRGDWDKSLTRHVAGALLALDRKLAERHYNRDSNWPLRIGELSAELARRHAAINDALLGSPEFGRADHVLFTQAPGFDRHRTAEIFLARAAMDSEFAWSPALVRLVGELPEERALPVLRPLWGKGGLDEALLPVLARHPQAGDRNRFLAGLNALQPATVGTCLDALAKLAPPRDGADLLALVRCLRRLPEGKEGDALRRRVGEYLERVTGRGNMGADARRWAEWFARTYPQLAARLEGADGVDVAGWRKRLADLDWSKGDAGRGRAAFVKASCAVCHSGAQALGPDLHGITGRFSRDDLFTAILLPSKDISPRYRTTAVSLRDGKTYQGLVIYEATDSLILQTGPATTVRVPAEQVESRRFSDVSLMPAGLLDPLKDQDIVDLYTYLKELGKP